MSAPNFPTSTFAENTLIFSKGDAATKFFMIQSGSVEIFDPAANQSIAILSEGDAFGEQAILVGGIRGASARALKTTVCIEVTTIKLREMLRHEEGILRPTIEALLLQLTMHNELKSLAVLGSEPVFKVSKRFATTFTNPSSYEIVTESDDEFTPEERIRINREVEKAKHFVILQKDDRIDKVYEQLKLLKENEARERIAAAKPKQEKPAEPEEKKIKREELTEFLASEEAKSLPTKDLLYLKLFDNKSLESIVFNPGQKILAPGDQPNKAYIITSGEVSHSCPLAPISIGAMINQLSQEYLQIAEQSGLVFDKKLPEKIDTIEVFADAIMIERVLRNLLTNATSHTAKGGVRLRLKVVKRNGKERLEFRVVDTGPGIQAAERARIFEEFYQSEVTRELTLNTPNTVRNLGLGLAISSRLAELLKTQIKLHSYLGKGSIFSFDLPMQYSAVNASALPVRSAENSQATTAYLQQTCIAVIDDDPHILDATQQLLASYGAKVLIAESAQQAWEAVHRLDKAPDIFLVDHRLNRESGLRLIQTIHEKYGPTKPCILITGDTSADQVAKFHQAGIRVLYKPITDGALIEAICAELLGE